MSRTLVSRTNKEFDKCAELLRNILTVQGKRHSGVRLSNVDTAETRRNSKSSPGGDFQRKQLSPGKKPPTKSTLIKANVLSGAEMPERRSSYSPSKSTGEVRSSAESKSRKHSTRSPSPLISKSRQRSPPSPSRRLRRPIDRRSELVRSSSCGDLPSSATRMQTRVIIEQFVRHLTRIRTISKQIRTGDPDSYRLWTDLETSLASALTYANEDIQYQLSLQPLRDELVELRRQMQSTNAHLRQFVPPPPPVGYSQLLVRNQELQSQCDLLQDKLDSLERTNIRLIQRWTQQDLRSLAERSDDLSSETRFHLREEIYSLKEKLYHVYDDLATLFNRNQALEITHLDQKQQLNEMKQSARDLLLELDKRTIDEKIKRFLHEILLPPGFNTNAAFHPSHITPTKVPSSTMLFETPHKGPCRSRGSPLAKLRPKSLFVTPTVLNDGNALSRFQQSRSPARDPSSSTLTPCSSSTICDAESISTSSLVQQQHHKRNTQYTSLPILNLPAGVANESETDFDQISDLTSKMFTSDDDDEDRGLGVSDQTSASTTLPTD